MMTLWHGNTLARCGEIHQLLLEKYIIDIMICGWLRKPQILWSNFYAKVEYWYPIVILDVTPSKPNTI